jgi:hypothetical protein
MTQEMRCLAEAGSVAAIGALVLINFADERDGWREINNSPTYSRGLPLAIIKHAAPACSGLLAKHLGVFLAHPGKQRRTCDFLAHSHLRMFGFVPIDRDRLPAEAIEAPPKLALVQAVA